MLRFLDITFSAHATIFHIAHFMRCLYLNNAGPPAFPSNTSLSMYPGHAIRFHATISMCLHAKDTKISPLSQLAFTWLSFALMYLTSPP